MLGNIHKVEFIERKFYYKNFKLYILKLKAFQTTTFLKTMKELT